MAHWCLATDTPLQTEGGGGGPAHQEAQLRLSLSAPSLYALHPLYTLCRKSEWWLSCQEAGRPCCHMQAHLLSWFPARLHAGLGRRRCRSPSIAAPHVGDAVRTGAVTFCTCAAKKVRCTGQTARTHSGGIGGKHRQHPLENKEGLTVLAAEHHLDEGLHSPQGHNSFNEV